MLEMMTMRASVAKHLAAGVEGLDELSALVSVDIGRVPGRESLRSTKHGLKHPEKRDEMARRMNARWWAKHPEKARERKARWQAANPAKKLLGQCRSHAKARGHECSITTADIEALLAPMVCFVTGLPLTLTHEGDSKTNPWAPSLDRLDNSIGYIKSNVRVVCWAFNMMRADWPDDVVMTLVRALAERPLIDHQRAIDP